MKIKQHIPLLFLVVIVAFFALQNINSFHDWGDDFAQYIFQAKVFLEGEQLQELHAAEYYSPKARGAGFTLFLSFIYSVFGLDISAFLTGISFTYLFLSIVLYFFFLRFFDEKKNVSAALFSLVFILNYHVLALKMEVMPTFLMMLLVYLFFLTWQKKEKMFQLIGLLFLGFAISIANIAWVLFIALIVESFIKIFSKKEEKSLLMFTPNILIPIVVYYIVKTLVFKNYNSGEITWYANVFNFQDTLKLIVINFEYYHLQIKIFWEQEIWSWFNFGISWLLLFLFFVGFIFRCWKKFQLIDGFFILYLLVLMLYPYQKAGIRFLMPIIPIFLIYISESLKLIFQKTRLKDYQNIFYSLFFSVLILSNLINWKNWWQSEEISEGPQNKMAIEAFTFIQQNTNKADVIAFTKPWTMLLFGERSSLPVSSEIKDFDLIKMMQKHQVKYLLFSKSSEFKKSYRPFIQIKNENKNLFELAWKNEDFELYKLSEKAAINN